MIWKRIMDMRKYIVGAVIGAAVMFSATAYGADLNLVGHKVQGEYAVVVDGSALPQKSIGVDGTTYAPLRAIGDATGYDVSFADKTVTFTSRESSGMSDENTAKLRELTKELSDLNAQGFELLNSDAAKLGNPGNDELLKKLDEIKQERKDLQAQIDALKAQQNQ